MVILWDLTDPYDPRRIGEPFAARTGHASSVAFSPDGTILACGTAGYAYGGGLADAVILWDITDPHNPRRIGDALAQVSSVVFNPEGTTMAGISGAGVVLWNLADRRRGPYPIGDPLRLRRNVSVTSVAFSPDGANLACGAFGELWDEHYKSGIVVWDVTDPRAPRRVGEPLLTSHGAVTVAFSPDGATLASGTGESSYPVQDDGQVVLWDVDITGRRALHQIGDPLPLPGRYVTSVAFSPDGATLACGTVAYGPFSMVLPEHRRGAVVLWDVTDRQNPRTIGDPFVTDPPLGSVAFNRDGTIVAGGVGETQADGSPGLYEGAVVLWDVGILPALGDNLRSRACRAAGRGLTQEEWSRYIPDLPYSDTCPR